MLPTCSTRFVHSTRFVRGRIRASIGIPGVLAQRERSLCAALNNDLLIPQLTKNLKIGSIGPDVTTLQVFLNNNGYPLAASGIGSPGAESAFFGAKTAAALMKLQGANGLPTTGFFGPLTRALLTQTGAAAAALTSLSRILSSGMQGPRHLRAPEHPESGGLFRGEYLRIRDVRRRDPACA